ncbi:hypothetical protein ACTFIY_004486 [Dictyostelium cf. discoideum]
MHSTLLLTSWYTFNGKLDLKKSIQVIPGIKFCTEPQVYANVFKIHLPYPSFYEKKNDLNYFMIFEIEETAKGTNIPMGYSWSSSFYPIDIELKADEKESEKLLDLNSIVNSMNCFSQRYIDTEKMKTDFNELKNKMIDFKNSFTNSENNDESNKESNDENNDENNNENNEKISFLKKERYLCEIGNVYEPKKALFQINYHNYNIKKDSNFELINLKNSKYDKENQKKGLEEKYKNNKKENSLKILKGELLQKEINKINDESNQLTNSLVKFNQKLKIMTNTPQRRR